mmetsp:Transcript_23500/g.67133  ORF Transcript_23500/g.67133 Transcript_23500/m.67133 type:complete len:268 (+) Transcript_23500:584-1387(+)
MDQALHVSAQDDHRQAAALQAAQAHEPHAGPPVARAGEGEAARGRGVEAEVGEGAAVPREELVVLRVTNEEQVGILAVGGHLPRHVPRSCRYDGHGVAADKVEFVREEERKLGLPRSGAMRNTQPCPSQHVVEGAVARPGPTPLLGLPPRVHADLPARLLALRPLLGHAQVLPGRTGEGAHVKGTAVNDQQLRQLPPPDRRALEGETSYVARLDVPDHVCRFPESLVIKQVWIAPGLFPPKFNLLCYSTHSIQLKSCNLAPPHEEPS